MNFSDIRNNLYEKAEKYWYVSLFVGLGVQIVSIISTVSQNRLLTITASTILFFAPIIGRWFQEKFKDNTLRAIKCRLAILYSDASGKDIPFDIAREIKSWVSEEKLSKAPFRKPYYDSKLPYGSNRLADIITESAFWTYKLADDMRSIMFLYTGVYLISALTAIYFIFQINMDPKILIDAAKLITTFISIIFTSEAILLIKQYNELYSEARRIYTITAGMVSISNLDMSEIMQIVEEYNILLLSSPPIPGYLYKIRQKNLNKAYKKVIKKE